MTRSPDASEVRFWVTSAGMPLLSTAEVPVDGEEKIEWVKKKDMMNIICDLKKKAAVTESVFISLTFLLYISRGKEVHQYPGVGVPRDTGRRSSNQNKG